MTNSLYSRITEYTNHYCHLCDEWKALCPDCDTPVCVFCEDACKGCDGSLF